MRERNIEIVVVGGGTMGSAAAWQLAQRGHEVVLFEQFEFGHCHGASHGATRNFNMAYEKADYIELALEARKLWDDLADRTQIQVLDLVGLVNHGSPAQLMGIQEALASYRIEHEWVPPDDAASRWTGMRFQGNALFIPGSGRVRAAEALLAMREAATSVGATFFYETPVRSIKVESENSVLIETDGDRIRARRVVVTAGAWADKIIGKQVLLPPLRVSEEQPSHFDVIDKQALWPSFNHMPAPTDAWSAGWNVPIYGMLSPGEGVKVGWHKVGELADPDRRDPSVNQRILETLQAYVREWIPGLDFATAEPVHCTYTSTPSEDFVLDAKGPLIVGSGFSGHGFKFTPVIGRVLADLVVGKYPAQRFRQLG